MSTNMQIQSSMETFDSINGIKEPCRQKFWNPKKKSAYTVQVLPDRGVYYVHNKTSQKASISGLRKTCKLAERGFLIQKEEVDSRPAKKQKTGKEQAGSLEPVARLVIKIKQDKESLIRVDHDHFVSLLPHLKDIPGIVDHYDHVEAVNKKGEKQFVYYQEKYAGDLGRFLQNKKTLTSEQLKKITEILLKALAALHEQKIYHRDLKPENVLIDLKKIERPVALCDFDVAVQTGMSQERLNLLCGSWQTRSPEMMRVHLNKSDIREEYLASNDVWGMGMILHFLYHRREFPFHINRGEPTNATKTKIAGLEEKDISIKSQGNTLENDKIDSVLKLMLNPDPSKRISAKGALESFLRIEF